MWQPVDAQTNQRLTLQPGDWPLLIHGAPKCGASFFTVVLTADLIRRGERVVFLCAQGAAIRALQQELATPHPAVKYLTVTAPAANMLAAMQLVTFFRRQEMDLLTSLRSLTDWNDRIVVITNAEQLLTPALWAVLKSHRRLVISGDGVHFNFSFDPQVARTVIAFSPTSAAWTAQRSSLPNFIGEWIHDRERKQVIVAETTKPL